MKKNIPSDKFHLAIVAGEASGDNHGVELMKALKKQVPSMTFTGLGGPQMEEYAKANNTEAHQFRVLSKLAYADEVQGIPVVGRPRDRLRRAKLEQPEGRAERERASQFRKNSIENWIETAGVLGLWDVLKKYGYFRTKFSMLLHHLKECHPHAIILVDYPGFNLRLAKAIRRLQLPIKIFYYISPQVWAWHKSRIPKIAHLLDLMVCIFPFEKKLYESSGLPTTFVGHPLVEKLTSQKETVGVLKREEHLLGLFPGSREREVRRIFPVMVKTAQRVMSENSKIHCEAAAATEARAEEMRAMAEQADIHIIITVNQARELMQRATFGLVCSGTATLEAACLGLPYALVYKVAWLTYVAGRLLIRVPYLGIINILACRPVVREFIQQDATAENLAKEALRLLNNPEACKKLSEELTSITAALHGHGAYDHAAETMVTALKTGR
ncbi:MAG TPA: lipid-A-disaccharide synthase [Chthoniobacterales bacterium]|nr:lipid-A-disaccharide synthase [Chthoniobacterales bacterium]